MIYYGDELYHYGTKGMKWYHRLYQNEDGTLTPLGKIHYRKQQERLNKKDIKWAHKKYNKIYKTAYNRSKQELNDYIINDLDERLPRYNANGRISAAYANELNKKMAEVMTRNASDFQTPSGKAVKYVAKRAEVGVEMIISDQNYDTSTDFKNGVYSSGRLAYKQKVVNRA